MKKQDDYELRKEYDLAKMTALAEGHFALKSRTSEFATILEVLSLAIL